MARRRTPCDGKPLFVKTPGSIELGGASRQVLLGCHYTTVSLAPENPGEVLQLTVVRSVITFWLGRKIQS